MKKQLRAGAHEQIINPKTSQFLFGYPNVERWSTGVHDDLYTAALYLDDGSVKMMFITNDLIYVPKEQSQEVRNRITEETGIDFQNIMVTATHTHSGPHMKTYASNQGDPVVGDPDPEYVKFVVEKIIETGLQAFRNAEPAVLGAAAADSTGIGTNRRDPEGPADHEVPVLTVMDAQKSRYIAVMAVVSMHPTVLHEDSTLISADFLGPVRSFLKKHAAGPSVPILLHTGPSGNQSPRHAVEANTFSEAERIGEILGASAADAVKRTLFSSRISLSCGYTHINDLPRKQFPPLETAEQALAEALKLMEEKKKQGRPRTEIRTLECDIFGLEEQVTLARLFHEGKLDAYWDDCLPVEIQVFAVGPWMFAAWPGEVFIEYSLQVKQAVPGLFVITLANGELQGYIATPEAAEEGGYEAMNALFEASSGQIIVEETRKLAETTAGG